MQLTHSRSRSSGKVNYIAAGGPSVTNWQRTYKGSSAQLRAARRREPDGTLLTILAVEVSKAMYGLASGRAPGSDGSPVEAFRQLRGLAGLIAQLFTCILRRGRTPRRLLKLYIALLDKPGEPPPQSSS